MGERGGERTGRRWKYLGSKEHVSALCAGTPVSVSELCPQWRESVSCSQAVLCLQRVLLGLGRVQNHSPCLAQEGVAL